MRVREVVPFLERALRAWMRPLLVGPPGCGKSQMYGQAARRCGMEQIILSAPLQSPVKVGGYPRPPAQAGAATLKRLEGYSL